MAVSSNSTLIERYSSALFSLATEARAETQIETDAKALLAAISASPELTQLLSMPIVAKSELKTAFQQILAKMSAHKLTVSAVDQIVDQGRLPLLPAILKAVVTLAESARGELRVAVTSAKPLADKARTNLLVALKKSLGKPVTLDEKTDASLLGGMILKMGSRMLDFSLATQLNKLKHTLSN